MLFFNLFNLFFSRSTILVELKTDGNTEALSFAPGDHVGIFPENSPELVDGILKHLPDAPPVNQSLHLESLSHSSHGNSLISVIICKYSWEVFLLGPKIQAYSFMHLSCGVFQRKRDGRQMNVSLLARWFRLLHTSLMSQVHLRKACCANSLQ